MWLPLLLMSFTLSIDALGIGIAYGIKNVKITWIAKLIIGMVSVVIMWLSAAAGGYMMRFLPDQVTKILGVAILMIMGGVFIRNSLSCTSDATYDFDKSSRIEGMEGLFLGIALSADSISAGIAAATMGISGLWLSLCVGILQILFLCIGTGLVQKTKVLGRLDSRISGIVSGLIFIGIGILRLVI